MVVGCDFVGIGFGGEGGGLSMWYGCVDECWIMYCGVEGEVIYFEIVGFGVLLFNSNDMINLY